MVQSDAEQQDPKPQVKRKRGLKAYSAEVAAEITRRVLREQPSRALRDQLYAGPESVPGATTTLIDHIQAQMDGKRLPAARRKRWERAANRLADDGTVTLAELEERLR